MKAESSGPTKYVFKSLNVLLVVHTSTLKQPLNCVRFGAFGIEHLTSKPKTESGAEFESCPCATMLLFSKTFNSQQTFLKLVGFA